MSASERRRCGSGITSMTMISMFYLLLGMFGMTAAVPSAYLQLFNQGPILDTNGNAILFDGPMPIDETVDQNQLRSQNFQRDNFVILPAGNPFPLTNIDRALEGDDRPESLVPMKRSPSKDKTIKAASDKMMRLARNLPENLGGEKMYQISNIGDLPMFRFGK